MDSLSLVDPRTVVVIGAHPDDIEIGAGGFLLAIPPGTRVHYVLCTGTPERRTEARTAVDAFLPKSDVSFAMHDLPDGRLPAHWDAVKDILESAARVLPARLVLTPARDDAHQDHRLLAEMAPTAFRDAMVLQYEIPKWDGDIGRRNVYVPLSESRARRKLELLNDAYPSQKAKYWWDDEVFLGWARVRGMECRSRYAEAYTCDKMTMGLAR